MSVPGRYWCWTAPGNDGVLNCFSGSPGAARAPRGRDGPAKWLESVTALRPDLELADGAVLTTWPDGAYSAAGLDEQALAAPAGRLHFAGEHTAGPWAGLMEGALRSGIRAAREVTSVVLHEHPRKLMATVCGDRYRGRRRPLARAAAGG